LRRLIFLVYALIFSSELLQASIVPLLPTFAHEFAISKPETGTLLAATPIAMVIVSVPIGFFADRIGARVFTVGAGAVITASALVQGFASSYWMLLGGRIGFGVAFGAIWTAGPTLIATAAARGRTAAMGGTVVAGGAAHLVGPALAGNLAEHVGRAVPFILVAALTAVVVAFLAFSPRLEAAGAGYPALLSTLRAVRAEPQVVGAIVTIALLGLVTTTVPLLVSLQLAENGLSAGAIGTVFSLGACVWIVASTLAAKTGERVMRMSVAGGGILLLGSVLLLPAASAATAVLVAFVLLRALFHAPLSALSYPLGAAGARLAGIGGGAVIGLMNLAWAISASIAPVAGGAIAEAKGEPTAYACMSASCVVVAFWIYAGRRRAEAEAEAEVPA
jgi:predicted MFS family arabinose efflux permease